MTTTRSSFPWGWQWRHCRMLLCKRLTYSTDEQVKARVACVQRVFPASVQFWKYVLHSPTSWWRSMSSRDPWPLSHECNESKRVCNETFYFIASRSPHRATPPPRGGPTPEVLKGPTKTVQMLELEYSTNSYWYLLSVLWSMNYPMDCYCLLGHPLTKVVWAMRWLWEGTVVMIGIVNISDYILLG